MENKLLKKFFFFFLEDKKIYTLYALRFILFLLIFAHHTYKHLQIDFIRQPALGVAGFIILSGFLNGYIYKNKYNKINIKEMFNFTIKRIKKFYPLHIIMILVYLPLSGIFNYNTLEQFLVFFKKLICNLTLTQSYINNESYYFSFNGPTWYLSTYLFLSFLTIPILVIINKLNSKKHSKISLSIIGLILFTCTFFIVNIVKVNKLNMGYWIYVFPPVRLFEYIIGMIIGNIFKDIKFNFKYDKIVFTILEIGSIILLLVFMNITKIIPNGTMYIDKRLNLWIIPLIILITILSYQKGLISFILKSKFLVFLGEISMYIFMIHQPLIIYLNKAIGSVAFSRIYAIYILIMLVILGSIINKVFEKKNKKINEVKNETRE